MPEWVLYLMGQAFTAGAVYGAIRGDIKAALAGVSEAKDIGTRAHGRIDDLLIGGKR